MKASQNKFTGGRFPLLLGGLMLASFIVVNYFWPDQPRKQFIDGDGSGYYAYLPSLVIHHTVDFSKVFEIEKQKRAKDYQGHYFHPHGKIFINKYTVGTSLMQLPFFLIAYFLALIFGMPPDGYSLLFQYSVAMSAFVYVFVGLVFLFKLLKLYGLSNRTSSLLVLACLFGTNLFHYTFLAPSMSHAYSFPVIAIFLYCIKRLFLSYDSKYVYAASILLGLIILIRPVNAVIVVFVPFMASTLTNFRNVIQQKVGSKDLAVAVLLFLFALSPQLIINFMQTGKSMMAGYQNEGFYWSSPEMLNFLFSYRKGWFLYTPLMLLIIPAVFYLFRRPWLEPVSFLLFFLITVYLFSSWWNWFYGNSFGMRPMVDFYALFILVIGLFAQNLRKRWIQIGTGLFIMFCILLNLFQTWQYDRGILHYDSMNRQAYWHIFLRSGEDYRGVIGDESEYFYGELSERTFHNSFYSMDANPPEGWNSPVLVTSADGMVRQAVLNDVAIYSPSYALEIPDSLTGMKNIYVIVNANYSERQENAAMETRFVVDISGMNGELLFYKTFAVKRLPDEITNQWREGRIGFKLPVITSDMERIKLYVWNMGKETIYLKYMGMAFYTYHQ